MATRLDVSQHDRVLLLKLESDDGYPRLERKILAEMAAQVHHSATEPALLAAVISGTSHAFAAGAEITELAKLVPAEAFEFARYGQSVMDAVAKSPKPVIATIQGYCMGGGLDLALACRAHIASPGALFAHPGGSLGIITGWGGTQRLPRLIGRARALDMLVTGRRLDAQDALGCGLIDQLVDPNELLPAAIRQAQLRSIQD